MKALQGILARLGGKSGKRLVTGKTKSWIGFIGWISSIGLKTGSAAQPIKPIELMEPVV
jgi:hypothetical protein